MCVYQSEHDIPAVCCIPARLIGCALPGSSASCAVTTNLRTEIGEGGATGETPHLSSGAMAGVSGCFKNTHSQVSEMGFCQVFRVFGDPPAEQESGVKVLTSSTKFNPAPPRNSLSTHNITQMKPHAAMAQKQLQ